MKRATANPTKWLAPLLACCASTIAPSACSFPDYQVDAETADGGPVERDTLAADDVQPEVSLDSATRDSQAEVVASDADAGESCPPVRQLNFPLSGDIKLTCASALVFEVTVPDAVGSLVFARANLGFVRTGLSRVPASWTARLEVGQTGADRIGLPASDDLCAGPSVAKVVTGYGKLDASHDQIQLYASQGGALCSPGTVTLDAKSSIDVWVESAKPGCARQALVVASYMKGAGSTTDGWEWPLSASAAPIVSASIVTRATDTSLVTIGTIQGTVETNPNTACGSEVSTLTMHTTLDGATLSTGKQAIPGSSGVGHLVLDTFNQGPVGAGTHTLQLTAGRDFATSKVLTGGGGGDAVIAVIRKY